MIDQEIQKNIQEEIQKAFLKRDQENAAAIYFDSKTGRAFNGKNLFGFTGDRVSHNSIRTNLTEQTIASGVIKFTSSDISIFTQSGASTDDLDTINPSPLAQGGDLLIIRAGDDADTVVVKNGTGNIVCFGDFSMSTINHRMLLQWDRINENWVELARFNARETNWTNWTPTYSASGTMTFTSVTTTYAHYLVKDDTVHFSIKATGTTGGAASSQIRFTLPTVPDNDFADGISGGGLVIDGGYLGGFFAHQGTSNTIAVTRYDLGNWSLGAGRGFAISGFYKKTL